ncbi:MAG: rod shape-determining protein MreC [Candidatus Campbellbacteria bacterium]|nr:rod shape-determining protein MreC [Candidatus Campbellbacteria bacterium]
MSNRLNKRTRVAAISLISLLFVLIIISVAFGRNALNNAFSPVLALGANVNQASGDFLKKFQDKDELIEKVAELTFENEKLARENRSKALLAIENEMLKEMLGRKSESGDDLTITRVISRPPITSFDTLIIDMGREDGVEKGDAVLSSSSNEIGYIEKVLESSANVRLYSSPGERTPVEIDGNGTLVVAEGTGGGSIAIQAPRFLDIEEGALVTKPALDSTVIASIESVESGETDAFQLVRGKLPINVFEVSWVFVEIVE